MLFRLSSIFPMDSSFFNKRDTTTREVWSSYAISWCVELIRESFVIFFLFW